MLDDQKDINHEANNTSNGTQMSVKDTSSNTLYDKANKLITALFMVTDIMDKDEPIRSKLRSLGMDIISDIHISPVHAQVKIDQATSFLDIASTIGMISEMNSGILKKEFKSLKQKINEVSPNGNSLWLEEFILPRTNSASGMEITEMERATPYQGHKTRIGVQKGDTLLKALRSVQMSDKVSSQTSHLRDNFDVLKKQRRDEIIKVINENKEAKENGGLTITDIKNKAKNNAAVLGITALLSCSEKTLQRELVSMVKDNILKKSGEKRWSKYFI